MKIPTQNKYPFGYALSFFSVLLLFLGSCNPDENLIIAEPDPDPVVEEETFEGNSLPVFSINTAGLPIQDDPRINLTASLSQSDEVMYSGNIAIEIRGSSSQLFPKKSYGFETRDSGGLDTDVSFLGLPEEEDWILNGPYSDKTLIRNTLIYQLARDMNKYASRTRFVNLIINGNYEGIYVLQEKLKRDTERIDLDALEMTENSGEDVTGGYIIRIDRADGPFDQQNSFLSTIGSSLEGSSADVYFVYDYPKKEEITVEQKAYISNYVSDFENALASDNFADPVQGYAQYIDVDSFIDFFILNELSNNVDGFRLSVFLNKDRNEKLKMGPIWDFNLGFGNADYCGGGETDVWAHRFNERCGGDSLQVPFWWPRFLEDPNFVLALQARWFELRGGALSSATLESKIDIQIELLRESGAISDNFDRWPVFGMYIWPNNFVGADYNEEEAYLREWLNNRVLWLDAAINSL